MGVTMATIRTITDFVKALGGDAALGAELGISYNAVMMWRLRNQISSGFHLRLLAMARKRGIDVAPEVFGYDAEDVQELFHNAPVKSDTPYEAVA